MIFYHLFCETFVTLQVLFKVIVAFACIWRNTIGILTWRVANRMTNSCVTFFISIGALADSGRNAIAILAVRADWITLKARNIVETFEAFTFVRCDTLGVETLKIVVGERANRLALAIE